MKKSICILVVILVLGLAPAALAQLVNPAVASTPIVAVKGETLTIAVTALVDFDVNAGGTTPAQTLTITSNWNLTPARASVDICAAGTDLAPVDVSNLDSIPVAQVEADPGVVGTFAAINAGSHCGVTSTLVKSYPLSTAATRKNVTAVDTVAIRLAGVDAALQADTYKGTITVYAYAL